MLTSTTLRGAFTALITPFMDDQIDETALRNLVEFQIAGGIHGLVACGSTGETPTLTDAEFETVSRIVIEQTAGRVPVIVGTGSNSTRQAIARTQLATEIGADAAMVVMPWYNKPTQAGMEAHVRAIVAETRIPILLYNVPGRTASDIQPATIARLAMLPAVIGIKEASGSVDRTSEILQHTAGMDFTVISGDDALTLPVMAVGGTGIISVASNVVPAAMANLTTLIANGQLTAARTLHYELLDLFRSLFVESNPVPVKTAAELLGLCGRDVRLPLVPLQQSSLQQLTQSLEHCPHTANRLVRNHLTEVAA